MIFLSIISISLFGSIRQQTNGMEIRKKAKTKKSLNQFLQKIKIKTIVDENGNIELWYVSKRKKKFINTLEVPAGITIKPVQWLLGNSIILFSPSPKQNMYVYNVVTGKFLSFKAHGTDLQLSDYTTNNKNKTSEEKLFCFNQERPVVKEDKYTFINFNNSQN